MRDPNITHQITFTASSFGITYWCNCKGTEYRRKCLHIEQARQLGAKDERVVQAIDNAHHLNNFKLDEFSWPEEEDWDDFGWPEEEDWGDFSWLETSDWDY